MKPVILFLAANPASTPRLAVAQEYEMIKDELRRSVRRDHLVLYDGQAVTRDTLAALVARHGPVLLHFAGHGTSDGISLEHGTLAVDDLVRLLRARGGNRVRVVLMNSCFSDALAEALLEVADCVMGMDGPVGDARACAFAAAFYRGLSLGWSVGKAFEHAEAAVAPPTNDQPGDAEVARDMISTRAAEPSVPRLRSRPGLDPARLLVLDRYDPLEPDGPATVAPPSDGAVDSWEARLMRQGLRRLSRAIPAVELTAALLRVTLFDDPGTAQQDLDDIALAIPASELAQALAALLDTEPRPEHVSVPVVRKMLQLLDRASERGVMRPGAVALVTARAVDARFGPQFQEYFRHPRRLLPRDPYPIVCHPSGPGVEAYDRVTHLGIASDAVSQLSICIVNVVDAVSPRVRASTMAAAITNAVIRPEIAWDTYEVAGHEAFYAVRPAVAAIQRERIMAALDRAKAAGVNVLVFPELITTEEILAELQAAGAFDACPLVVAGSFHEARNLGEPGRNVTVVMANGQEVVRHHKFSASSYQVGDERCLEHLQRRDAEAGFDLLIGAGCSLVVMTRADALIAKARIEELLPTTLLVVATHQHGDDLGTLADVLPGGRATSAVVACAGGEARFQVPDGHRPPPVLGLARPMLVICESTGKVRQVRITNKVDYLKHS